MTEIIILGVFVAAIAGLMFRKVVKVKNGKSCCK